MDARLWSVYGKRLETLKRPDLPNLAMAIVAYMRRLDIELFAGQQQNVSYVAFIADKGSFVVVVRGDDWQKIVPYLQSDQLAPPAVSKLPWYNRVASIANIDVYDQNYYLTVLGVLNGLFPEDFPTSYL